MTSVATTNAPPTVRPVSTLRLQVRNFFHHPIGLVGLAIVGGWILAALAAPLITHYDPSAMDTLASRVPPGPQHWLGTDQLGRDTFSLVLYGARVSIYIGLAGSFLPTLIGSVLGAIAGYFRGVLDATLVRISELVMTFPSLILVLIFVALIGPGVNNLIIVFSFTGWMTTFRLVRGEFLSLREETYVEAARAFGFPKWRIIFRHMLPNTLSPIVVAFTVNIAIYIIAEAGLSFLGLGVPVTTPTWGNMLAAAQSVEVMKYYWWLWVFPALAIVIFVAGVNFVGDALRDVMDPKYRRRPARRRAL